MGIHQEDVTLTGDRSEAAALELNLRLRELAQSEEFRFARITVGVTDPGGDITHLPRPDLGIRAVLTGELNHAGATSMTDRRDPGVAAARLAREFARWVERAGKGGSFHVGDLSLEPGANRNVIPETATVTLAVLEAGYEQADLADALYHLNSFAFGALVRPVEQGGEGLLGIRLEPSSIISTASRTRLSFDLRAADADVIARFADRVGVALDQLAQEFGVAHERDVAQRTPPRSLAESGQVLIMERSYGGSHNPRETELTGDLVRSTALQLGVTHRLLNLDTLAGVNLFAETEKLVPKRWTDRLARYVSGALHDTCNIAGRVASAATTDDHSKSKPVRSDRLRATNAE
jgi:hypothetical protein